jgi:putative ATPase
MQSNAPLAERIRPASLEEYIGQQHLLAEGAPLRSALSAGIIPSMILWGPPGVGKTTLAHLLANHTKREFFTLSAISSGVKDVREIIQKAENKGMFTTSAPVLFIDEIHRFSKAQQDSLLGAVEKGIVTLIGATTENPSFEVISALLSRCQVYTLQAHTADDLTLLLHRAVKQDSVLKKLNVILTETEALISYSGGDARKLLNLFELIVEANKTQQAIEVTNQMVTEKIQQNPIMYDKLGEFHYDIISAFIKSIRGSDPHAAVYWLARMVEGGEDPLFIARRLIISAAEDIGLANPNALLLANACFQAVETIGWPEARIVLSQCTIYLATSPKGNASYLAIKRAQSEVQKSGNLPVPLHLRNAPTQLMKELNYGQDYQYAHDFPNNFIDQEYMPENLSGSTFFIAGPNPKEREIERKVNELWKNKYT